MDTQNTGEGMIFPGEWHITYNYSAGPTVSKFFKTLQEEAKIMATKCSNCSLVMLPPRSYCERCFEEANDWIVVGDEGTIHSATIIYYKFEGHPEPPFAIAFVVLDEADTALVNYIEGIEFSDPRKAARSLKLGSRVKVVYKENREGKMSDFYYALIE